MCNVCVFGLWDVCVPQKYIFVGGHADLSCVCECSKQTYSLLKVCGVSTPPDCLKHTHTPTHIHRREYEREKERQRETERDESEKASESEGEAGTNPATHIEVTNISISSPAVINGTRYDKPKKANPQGS